jgi:hypothetical protein
VGLLPSIRSTPKGLPVLKFSRERGKFFSNPRGVTLWAVDRNKWVPIQVMRKAAEDLAGARSLDTKGCETTCITFLSDIVSAAADKYAADGLGQDGIVTLQSKDLHVAIDRERVQRGA